ncbi:MAG: hypothetical protein RBR15_14835 [Sphaerochaeta sp.]|nr:hypothetical protein [Sphaerochaeta sp.]
MAIKPDYTIVDPLLDSSDPLFVTDSSGSYGYRAQYKLTSMPFGLLYTASQHTHLEQSPLFFDNFTRNIGVSKQSITGLALKSHTEQFNELVLFFGFNKTEWADIFSVSRQTIYGWLRDELKPSGENASKISWLYCLLVAIPNRQERDRLFRGYIYHHISTCNCSLFEIFKSGLPSGYEMSDLVEIVSSLLKRSQKKAKELDELEKTGLASLETFDYNMKRLFS